MRTGLMFVAVALVATMTLLVGGNAAAGVLAYEGFSDVTHDADLAGYSGGTATGLGGAWSVDGSGAGRVNTMNRSNGPLLFPTNVTFAPTQSGANYQWAEVDSGGSVWSPGYPTRTLATPVDFGADGTYYMSYMARIHANDSNMMVGLSDGTDLLTTGINYYRGTSRFGFSYGSTPPGSDSPDSGVGVTNDQAYFVVAQLETSASGSDTISYKAYNSGSDLVHMSSDQLSGTGSGPDQWTMQQTISSSNAFDRLYAKLDGPGWSNFDEVRIGETWTDVTSLEQVVIPETSPGTKIGLNFIGGQGGGSVGALEVAGAPEVNQVYWNNLNTDYHGNGGAVPSPVVDSRGLVAGVGNSVAQGIRIEYDASTVWGTGIGDVSPDQRLMRGYLDSNSSSGQPFVTVQNTPFDKYDVVVYMDGDVSNGELGEYWVETLDGTVLTPRTYARDVGHFSGTYTQVPETSTTPGSAPTGNYVVFEGLMERDFRVRGGQVSGTRSPINAVQILDQSDPAVEAKYGALGFNFIGGGPGGGSVADGDLAGASGYAQAHWNNLGTDYHGNGGAVPASVLDNQGNAVGTNNDGNLGLRVEYDSNTVYGNNLPATSPDRMLMRGYLDDAGIGSSQPYVNISNVPYGEFDVVLYVDGDSTDGTKGQYWLETAGGDEITPRVFAGDVYNFNGRFEQVPVDSIVQGDAAVGNFVVFEGLTESDFRIRGSQVSGTRAPINAFQIVERVPEPSAIVLALLGLMGLLVCGRRWKRA